MVKGFLTYVDALARVVRVGCKKNDAKCIGAILVVIKNENLQSEILRPKLNTWVVLRIKIYAHYILKGNVICKMGIITQSDRSFCNDSPFKSSILQIGLKVVKLIAKM